MGGRSSRFHWARDQSLSVDQVIRRRVNQSDPPQRNHLPHSGRLVSTQCLSNVGWCLGAFRVEKSGFELLVICHPAQHARRRNQVGFESGHRLHCAQLKPPRRAGHQTARTFAGPGRLSPTRGGGDLRIPTSESPFGAPLQVTQACSIWNCERRTQCEVGRCAPDFSYASGMAKANAVMGFAASGLGPSLARLGSSI